MTARRVDCLRCKEFRAHHSRGLCRSCVNALRELGDLHYYPKLASGRPQRTAEDKFTAEQIAFQGTWVKRGLIQYPLKETA